MRRYSTSHRWLLWAALALPMACAGGKQKAGPQLAPSPDAPEWVFRTSYIDSKKFFGVGASAGVKNPGLARSRAGNRARNEVAKVIETYSASLMKDYSASISTGDLSNAQEEQLVEQAEKTFTSQLVSGVEVIQYYVDSKQGVIYALAELDLDKQAQLAAAKAKMGPGLSKWVAENQDRVLQGLDDGMKGRPSRPPPAPPTSDDEPGTVAPSAAPAAAAPPAAAAAPVADVRTCDTARYLCATGQGADRDTADVKARAELARIFESKIKSVAESYDSAARTISSKTGESWLETQRFTQQSLVSTDKSVRMSQIIGRWKEGNTYNSLVAIDRAQAASDLRERIEKQDRIVQSQQGEAEQASDPVQRLKHARAAVEAFVAREAMNSDLRVIRTDGRGIPAPVSMAELLKLLGDANRALRLGVAVAGRGAERVQACLEEALNDRGYEVQTKIDEEASSVSISGDFDVLILGEVRSEDRGTVGRSRVVNVRLTLRLKNNKTGRILKTITGSQKGSRSSVEAARSTAAYQLCKKKVPGMIRDIDRYFVR